jgi:ABC-type uncharacterized transport system substrate-binding protein
MRYVRLKRREFMSLLGGVTAAWPLAALSQQPEKIPRIGVLWRGANAEQEGSLLVSMVKGFSDAGYVDGRDIKLEYRFANDIPDKFKSMATELASSNVDVLIGVGITAATHAKSATTTIPIVFLIVGDPVGSKLVESLTQPGGNVTGFSSFSAGAFAKRISFLKEFIPGLARVGLLINPNDPLPRPYGEPTQASEELGLTIQAFEWKTTNELGPAFDTMKRARMQVFTTNPDGLAFAHRALIARIAAARGLPFSSWSKDTLKQGAVMSYAADQDAICQRAAVYVDKILKGANPGELPVEEPTKFQLFLNPKAAKAMGLTIPDSVVSAADGVVE